MRLSLMPRKSIFYTLFNQHAQNALEATQALERLLSDFTDVDNKARDIHAIEHYGDKLTHQIMQELNGTFVTPLDREDIVGLASRLDDVTDVCHDVAEMVVLYKVRSIRPVAVRAVWQVRAVRWAQTAFKSFIERVGHVMPERPRGLHGKRFSRHGMLSATSAYPCRVQPLSWPGSQATCNR